MDEKALYVAGWGRSYGCDGEGSKRQGKTRRAGQDAKLRIFAARGYPRCKRLSESRTRVHTEQQQYAIYTRTW